MSCDLLRAPACVAAVPVGLSPETACRSSDGRVTGPRRTQTTHRKPHAPRSQGPGRARAGAARIAICQSRGGAGRGAVRGPTWAASVFDSLGRKLVKGLIFIIVNAADRTVTVGVRVALVAERERVFSHNSARLSSTRYNSTQLLRVVPVTSVRARTMQCLWPISIALASQPSHHLSRPSSPSCRPIGFACRTATGRAPSAVQVARSKTASGLAEGPSVRTAVREGGTDPLSVCRAARTS